MSTKTTSNSEIRRLYLSGTDRKLTGLCGGIAEYFRIDSSLVRLAWIIATFATGIVPGIIAYFVAAIVVPGET